MKNGGKKSSAEHTIIRKELSINERERKNARFKGELLITCSLITSSTGSKALILFSAVTVSQLHINYSSINFYNFPDIFPSYYNPTVDKLVLHFGSLQTMF